MWRTSIEKLLQPLGLNRPVTFTQPASAAAIQQLEQQLRLVLPSELKALLSESDGLFSPSRGSFIWTMKGILTCNSEFRTIESFKELYMPFDHMLFIGDNGSGDQYFYPILAGSVRNPDIYLWNHENDSRQWFAGHMHQFLVRVITEQLK